MTRKRLCTLLAEGLMLVWLMGCASAVSNDGDFRARLSETVTPAETRADVEAEIRFGRAVAARLLGEYDGVDDAALQRYVNTLGQYLVQFSGRVDIEYHFWVIDSEQINAYATPGGYIFVTRAALAQMDNEAQLAGVLAHEIAHVREKHVVRALNIRGGSFGASLGQLTSGASDGLRVALLQATDAALSILTDTGLQQQDEFEADELALLIMTQAGYEPAEYRRFIARLGTASGEAIHQVNGTHPPFALRAAQMQQVMQEAGLENLNYALNTNRFVQFMP